MTGVKFNDLEPHHCRYVTKGEKPKDFRFCGKEKATGSSYCLFHHSTCYAGWPMRSHWMHIAEGKKEAA